MKALPETIDCVLKPMTREFIIRDQIEARRKTHLKAHFDKSDLDKLSTNTLKLIARLDIYDHIIDRDDVTDRT